jgi:hypothetical protein
VFDTKLPSNPKIDPFATEQQSELVEIDEQKNISVARVPEAEEETKHRPPLAVKSQLKN